MAREHRDLRVLTINSGSSSIKFSLYHIDAAETLELHGAVEHIGIGDGRFYASDGSATLVDKKFHSENHAQALQEIIAWLRRSRGMGDIHAAAHRIVHGGDRYTQPQMVTPELITALEGLVPLAPEHLPHEIDAIRELDRIFPDLSQVACFDTAFHRRMPQTAQMYPLPRDVRQDKVIRYGFHGLSYEYIMSELRREAGATAADGKVIIAHLGNGASMVAIKKGTSLDTTMGFTPSGGLVMSTRTGDLDPGVLLYLLQEKRMDVSSVHRMINKQSGLLGVSGISSDMQDLLKAESGNPHAAEAIRLFCYQARKFIGAYAAVLGGVDTLIFTGGMGENSAVIRQRMCENMDFLGIMLDQDRNGRNAPIISGGDSPVTVRVMKTNEALMMARHTYHLISGKNG